MAATPPRPPSSTAVRRPVYVVTAGPTLFGVHRPVPMRTGHTQTHIVGFAEEAHAVALAASLQDYRDTYSHFPPRDVMLHDVVSSGQFKCTIDAPAANAADAANAANAANNVGGNVFNGTRTSPLMSSSKFKSSPPGAVHVEVQCLDRLLDRLRGTDIMMAVLVWELGAGAGRVDVDHTSIMFQEDGFSWHVLRPTSSARDTVAHLARAAARSYETALLPKPVRNRPRDWLHAWLKMWAWIVFAILC